MGKRRKARESTLQILFQLEFDNSEPEKAIKQYWKHRVASEQIREYSSWLVKGIISHLEDIDRIIQSVSEHWRLSRMALVDRNILRMAVFELLFEESIAPAIIINEAIEIAKKYSNEEAAVFVNGVLDAVRKKLESEKKSEKEG
ncbi:MAG: transcription antitermination factor NusB [Candidatus Aminicenantales bacterium]